jgi:tetratricopeptide (TPR) repeat protein
MRKLFTVAGLLFAAVMAYAQTEIQVQTHNVVAADEQFNVTFVIEGENNPSGFTWAPGDDFSVLWGPQQGRSTSVQIVNGKTTKSVQTTYTYVLKPVKVGNFTLPSASAKVKGNDIQSKPVVIEVVASGSGSRPQSSGQSQQTQRSQAGQVSDDDIFINVALNRTNVVVGEPITATVKLYQRVNIAGFESAEFPTFNGFWSQETEAPTNIEFTRETYDGQIYNSAVLRKYVLIPQQQGNITINPAELVCLVQMRVSSPGTSIFDGFFDDYRTVRKKVVSKPVTVNVSPLPAGAPASFGGGVGEFAISARLSKDVLKTHEAASVIVTLSGNGNVSLLEAPKVNFPPDMEVYDTKVSENVSKGGTSGSKIYEFPFIPRSHGDFEIEPIRYSYYDVNAKKYVVLETKPIGFMVEKGAENESTGMMVPGTSRKDVKNLGSDIRFINTKPAVLAPKGEFFVCSGLFWFFLILLVLLSGVVLAVHVKMEARRADVAGTRNRKATKMALKRLQLAGTFLKQNLYTAFYEELHKALLGFISDKLNVPVAELSKDRIAEALKEGNVDQAHSDKFIEMLDACEFARYSPDSGHEAMTAHYNSAVDVISSIDSNMKSKNSNVKKTAVVAIALVCALPFAADARNEYMDSLWNAANQAYTEGRWTDAVSDYQMISDAGLESAALYCNIGDAFYKAGNVPEAILYYERALKLDPSYEDARFNLELMNNGIQDRIDPVPELILKTWTRKLCYLADSETWAVLCLVFFACTLAFVIVFLRGRQTGWRRFGFFAGIAMLIVSVMCFSFSIWQKKDYMRADEAIVMRPVASVKSSPSGEASTDLFILHEGTKVRLLDQVGTWSNIELADGRQGWMRTQDFEII